MRVVIFLSEFQHNVVNDFAQAIGEVLTAKGAEVIIADLMTENATQEVVKLFVQPVDFVLSFNGVGCNLSYKGQSFYDYVGTTFVMWLVDHPVHLIERVQTAIRNKVIVCIDETHADYLDRHLSVPAVTTFIAHAARAEELKLVEKKFDILFAGHIADPNELALRIEELIGHASEVTAFIDQLLLNKGNIELGSLFEQLEVRLPNLSSLTVQSKARLLRTIDLYIRAKKRTDIIRELVEHELTVDFFGEIPANHSLLSFPYFKCHAPVIFDEMKELYKQAKIILNVIPNFPYGGHERIFTSMMCGAVPLTDRNAYIEKMLPTTLSFQYNDVATELEVVRQLLNDDTLLQKAIQSNYEAAIQGHTWGHRVEELLYVVEMAQQYFKQS